MEKLDSQMCADCPLAAILKQSIELNKMVLKANLERGVLKEPPRARNKRQPVMARVPYSQYLN